MLHDLKQSGHAACSALVLARGTVALASLAAKCWCAAAAGAGDVSAMKLNEGLLGMTALLGRR
jgi:hypothetical protein